MWMFIGLLISFGTGAIFNYTGLFVTLFSSFGTMFTLVLAIVEIILVIILIILVYYFVYDLITRKNIQKCY